MTATRKITTGFFSITGIEDAESYVAWHQSDHMCEQFRIPGLTWGHRYFAPPPCIQASACRSADLREAAHIQNYLFEDVDGLYADFAALGLALKSQGRFRSGVHGFIQAPQRLTGTYAARDLTIGSDAVPFRPHTGIYLIVEDRTEPERMDVWNATAGTEFMNAAMRQGGVTGAWAYAAPKNDPIIDGSTLTPSASSQITVIYLDGDPVRVSDLLQPYLERRWQGAPVQPVLAGPYRSVSPPPARWCSNDDPQW